MTLLIGLLGTSAGISPIAGLADTANAPETATLASAEVVTGSAGTATAASTSDSTAGEVFIGAIGSGTAAQTSTLASSEVITGSTASANAAQSGALVGEEAFAGVVGSGQAAETSTLASAEVVTGSAASADDAQSNDLAGAQVLMGTLSTGTDSQTGTLGGASVLTNAVDTAQAPQSSDATGVVEVLAPPVGGSTATAFGLRINIIGPDSTGGECASGNAAQSAAARGTVTNVATIWSAQAAQGASAVGAVMVTPPAAAQREPVLIAGRVVSAQGGQLFAALAGVTAPPTLTGEANTTQEAQEASLVGTATHPETQSSEWSLDNEAALYAALDLLEVL